jgi:hypothetical protein
MGENSEDVTDHPVENQDTFEDKAMVEKLLKYLDEGESPDLSHEVKGEKALEELLRHPDYITGKISSRREELPKMSLTELAFCTGEEGDDWYNEAWVAIGDWIYNVTSKSDYINVKACLEANSSHSNGSMWNKQCERGAPTILRRRTGK